MRQKFNKIIFLIILSLLISGLFLPDITPLKASTQNFNLEKVDLKMPEGETLNGFTTLDSENFYFTNNKKDFYTISSNDPIPYEFKNLNNDTSKSYNLGIKMRNNLSFVFSTTEINSQKNYGLYKILENGQVATTEPYQKVYKDFADELFFYNISEVSDMCFDYYNNFYMLDIINKAVLTLNYKNIEQHENNRITIFKDLNFPSLDIYSLLNKNSKMCLTINGEVIYILSEQRVFEIDTTTKSLKEIQLAQEINLENVKDFACDCAGNLYFLTDNKTVSTLYKFYKKGTQESITLNKQFDEFFIEQYAGNMFFKSNNEIFKLNYTYFIASTISHPAPTNFNEKTYLQTPAKLALCVNNCSFYTSPYALEPTLTLPENSLLVILQNFLIEEPNFAYCLYENEAELFLGYVKISDLKEYSIYSPNTEIEKKTFVVTNVYKYPTRSSVKLTTISENTVVTILGTYSFENFDNNINFYCVEITNNNHTNIGYIAKDLVYSLESVEVEYTGGKDSPDKYSKFVEYLLIILGLTILEIVTIAIIVKKVKIKKKSNV